MSLDVPYLRKETIERDAESLLADFAQARGRVIAPPVPIEDIVEKHLKLRFEFDDTHRLFGLWGLRLNDDPAILGAIYFDEKRIVIDESLDPDERPVMEGRFRFTLAHEGCGHWRLHRHLAGTSRKRAQEALMPSVVCRKSDARERTEWQADYYASCVLMPRSMVYGVWHERFGDTKPRLFKRHSRFDTSGVENSIIREALEKQERCRDESALDAFLKPFAERFRVSTIAMRIRLEQLRLLHLPDLAKRRQPEAA